MKKLLLVLAIGAFVASCNDSGTTEAPKADSAATAPATADSSVVKPDSATVKPDSAATAKPDSAVKK